MATKFEGPTHAATRTRARARLSRLEELRREQPIEGDMLRGGGEHPGCVSG